ncbi:hypothetical protein TNCT_106121 [Trichonephila clavata]|uniref:Secreted protein n=1 Tax=Trichonephila clavata TaxID=2740835 RepID=A0A8X6L1E3_TRICU|nr:hypothetical protein TNCT_106121 [Trichonephila clavata]
MNVVICTCMLVTLVTVFSATHVAADNIRPYNKFNTFGLLEYRSRQKAWFDRPNVCVFEKKEPMKEEEFADFPRIGSWRCIGKVGRLVCVSRILENGKAIKKIQTHKCCPGFDILTNDGNDCEAEELRRPPPRGVVHAVHLPDDGILISSVF